MGKSSDSYSSEGDLDLNLYISNPDAWKKEYPWLSYIDQPLFHLIVFSSLLLCHCLAFVPIGVRQYEATAIFSRRNNPRPIRIEQDIRAIIKSSSPGTSVGCPFDNVINVINVTQKPLMDVILWGIADSRTTSTLEAELFFRQTFYRMQVELNCLDGGACSQAKGSFWNATSTWVNLLCWLRPAKNHTECQYLEIVKPNPQNRKMLLMVDHSAISESEWPGIVLYFVGSSCCAMYSSEGFWKHMSGIMSGLKLTGFMSIVFIQGPCA